MLYSTNIGEKEEQVIDPKAAAKALRAMKAREARLNKYYPLPAVLTLLERLLP